MKRRGLQRRFEPVGAVVLLVLLSGCATGWGARGPNGAGRVAGSALSGDDPRCIRLSSGADDPHRLPLADAETDPELAAWLSEVPADVRRTVLAAGLEPALARLLRDRASNVPEVELLARRLAIAQHLQSLKVQLDASSFEADCSGDMFESQRAAIEQAQNAREIRWTVVSLIVGALAATGAGSWELVEPDSRGPAVVGLAGGLVGAGLGLWAFVQPPGEIHLSHERNLLGPIVSGTDPTRIYPSFVFRMLTLPSPNGPSPREQLRGSFDAILSSMIDEGDRSRAEALLYGSGGTYDLTLLEARERMLDELETTIAAFLRDVEVLQRFLGRTLDQGCLRGQGSCRP